MNLTSTVQNLKNGSEGMDRMNIIQTILFFVAAVVILLILPDDWSNNQISVSTAVDTRTPERRTNL